MGELAEIAFMFRAAREGIGVAKPYGDSHPYDFLVQHGRRLLRVQVKSCFRRLRDPARNGFTVSVCHHLRKGIIPYTLDEIDYIAAFIAVKNAWYLIPVDALGEHRFIHLYPRKLATRNGGIFEQYREAWNQLKDSSAQSP